MDRHCWTVVFLICCFHRLCLDLLLPKTYPDAQMKCKFGTAILFQGLTPQRKFSPGITKCTASFVHSSQQTQTRHCLKLCLDLCFRTQSWERQSGRSDLTNSEARGEEFVWKLRVVCMFDIFETSTFIWLLFSLKVHVLSVERNKIHVCSILYDCKPKLSFAFYSLFVCLLPRGPRNPLPAVLLTNHGVAGRRGKGSPWKRVTIRKVSIEWKVWHSRETHQRPFWASSFPCSPIYSCPFLPDATACQASAVLGIVWMLYNETVSVADICSHRQSNNKTQK